MDPGSVSLGMNKAHYTNIEIKMNGNFSFNTELYIYIEHTLFDSRSDNFTVKVAQKPEEVKALLEIGFEYVCQKDNLIFLRKRK
jgi:hypothetical protein